MCGEKQHHVTVRAATLGSPPHVRGKVEQLVTAGFTTGITPACAGKSDFSGTSTTVAKDHPRMCGEKMLVLTHSMNVSGSPPHVRGKDAEPHAERHPDGITPACAGKSWRFVNFDADIGDHPRMCGEKADFPAACLRCRGSPPHVRGKARCNHEWLQQPGITPACAGKRLKRSRSIVPHAAIVPLFPSVCNKPAGSDGSPAGHDAPPFLPIENAAPASPAYNLRSL